MNRPCLFLLTPLIALSITAQAQQPVVSSLFLPGAKPEAKWTLTQTDGPAGFLKISEDPTAPGFLFQSPTKAMATTEWKVGTEPFELWFDVNLTQGEGEPWRYTGIAVVLSSAPLDAMTSADLSVGAGVYRAGVMAGLKQGGGPVSATHHWAN